MARAGGLHHPGRWTLILALLSPLAVRLVAGGCDDDDDDKKRNNDQTCWYKLWFLWFIVVLALVVIAILVFFYCKQKVKHSSTRRGRRCTPVLTMPRAPPLYDAPGHEPPPYHIAMAAPAAPDTTTAPGHAHCRQATNGATGGNPAGQLPGYVVDQSMLHSYDNVSMTSLLSVGAFSNPPPYSPPHTSHGRRTALNQRRGDVAL